MGDTVLNTLLILGLIAGTIAPPALLVYARHKQKRPEGFVDYDPGLGRWNSFPAQANERAPEAGATNSLIVGDAPDDELDDDPVARIRAKRKRQGSA